MEGEERRAERQRERKSDFKESLFKAYTVLRAGKSAFYRRVQQARDPEER